MARTKAALTLVIGDSVVCLRNPAGQYVFRTPLSPDWARRVGAFLNPGHRKLPVVLSDHAQLSLNQGQAAADKEFEISELKKQIALLEAK